MNTTIISALIAEQKLFVHDEEGQLVAVILPLAEYQRLQEAAQMMSRIGATNVESEQSERAPVDGV